MNETAQAIWDEIVISVKGYQSFVPKDIVFRNLIIGAICGAKHFSTEVGLQLAGALCDYDQGLVKPFS